MMKRLITALALVGALAVPATASAGVLYEPNGPVVVVGACIALKAWYQSYSGGSRYISAAVYRNGRPVTRRITVRASSRRTSWKPLLCPNVPGRRYTVRYWNDGRSWTESVRVGMGD
jgi:hypothetical protein